MNSRNRRRMMSFIVNRKGGGVLPLLFLVFALILLSGCAMQRPQPAAVVPSPELDQYLSDKPDPLKPMYAKVMAEGKGNFVLNQLQAGVAAMELGDYALAENSLDQALLHIESVYANTESAAQARSLWYEEGSKDFKGEPYERAMAYYYRGLLYMLRDDYENARACFKSGILQDAFAEEEQNQCDFALLIFLEGWASLRLGDKAMADAAFAELKKFRPDFPLPQAGDNTLVLLETGTSPRKVSDGVGHAALKYRRGKQFTEERVKLTLADGSHPAYPMEDLFYQARTRGGRPIDKILEGKAVFLESGLKIGTALTDTASTVILASTLFSNHSNATANIGAAIGGVGGVVTIIAMNAKPHADTRYWRNLPDLIHVYTLRDTGNKEINAVFTTAAGAPTELSPVTLKSLSDGQNGRLFWGRSRTSILN